MPLVAKIEQKSEIIVIKTQNQLPLGNGRTECSPTVFVLMSCNKLGFSGAFKKLVCIYEELPHRLQRSSLSKGALSKFSLEILDFTTKTNKLIIYQWQTNFSLPCVRGSPKRVCELWGFALGRWHFRKKMTEGVPLIKAN